MRHRFLAAALAAIALPAAAAQLQITPKGPSMEPAGRWTLLSGIAMGSDSVLRPQVTLGPGAVLQAQTPAGELRMVPLQVGTRSATPRALPAGEPAMFAEQGPEGLLGDSVLLVTDTWAGVDEVFALRGAGVKHDLIVHEDALAIAGRGDLAASWQLELPPGARARLAVDGGVVVSDALGQDVAFVPSPEIADADDDHWTSRVARLELTGPEAAPVLTLVVPESWAFDPARAFPLRLDPTLMLQPTSNSETGWVDETGFRDPGPIDSGSLALVGFGSDARGYAEFDTSAIPDGATITDVRLLVWLSNHDNPGDPAVPLRIEVKGVAQRASAPEPVLWAAIGGLFSGRIYTSENVPRTGAEFCPDSYQFRAYDLGADGRSDLQALLPQDWFTVGFASEIVTDPLFDHIDYIGFPEVVNNPFTCPTTDFPGTRITLVVDYSAGAPPVCDAGGPYVADCPNGPIALDGTGSFDPDAEPLTYAWTTDCPGVVLDPAAAATTLELEAGCVAECTVTLAVSDGTTTVSCTTTVSARDVTPPEIVSSDLTDFCLWPPRHDMFCLGPADAHVVARDACQPGVIVRWAGCASDQPDEAREDGRPENGDGHFADDCQVTADGELCVRVERAGSDPVDGRNTYEGRRYRVSVEVDDGCGNVVSVPGTLRVPHDRRGGSGGQDDPCVEGSKVK